MTNPFVSPTCAPVVGRARSMLLGVALVTATALSAIPAFAQNASESATGGARTNAAAEAVTKTRANTGTSSGGQTGASAAERASGFRAESEEDEKVAEETDDARSDGPLQLFPSRSDDDVSDGSDDRDDSDEPVERDGAGNRYEAPDARVITGKEGITVESLGSVDPNSGGILDETSGGLPVTMWSGTPRAAVIPLIEAIPARYDRFPAARELALKVVASTAELPPALEGRPSTEASPLAARADKLVALGYPDEAVALVDALDDGSDPTLNRLRTEARLAAGRVDAACRDAGALAATAPDLFWQKLEVFCQARAGEEGAAQLGAQLLQELGENDPLYFALMDSILTGITTSPADLSKATPLHGVMMTRADVRYPDGVLEDAPAAIATLATLVTGNPATAEMAARRGLVDTAQLRSIYASAQFDGGALSDPLGRAESLEGPMTRALLYQAAEQETAPAVLAELLAEALSRAWVDGGYPDIVPAFADQLDRIEPQAALTWFAAEAARAYYYLDRLDKAQSWHALALNASEQDTARAGTLLWPFAQLSGSRVGVGPVSRNRWERALNEVAVGSSGGAGDILALVSSAGALESAGGVRAAALALPLVPGPDVDDSTTGNSTGDETGSEGSHSDIGAYYPRGAGPAILRAALYEASADGRLAETAVLALRLLRFAADTADPGLYSEVARGLSAVGLDREARRIALEAIAALRN